MASPTVVTTPNATSVTLGTTAPTLNDSALLSGGYSETGTITFTLYDPSNTLVYTDVVTIGVNSGSVTGNGTYSTLTMGDKPGGYRLPTTGTVIGTYQWDASYSGDGNNQPASENNNPNEQVVVVKPAVATLPTTQGGTVSAGGGVAMTDSATLSGDYFPTGTITFYLLPPGSTSSTPLSSAVYTDVITIGVNSGSVTGNGTYNTSMGANPGGYLPPASAAIGTYNWVATYSGDGNNNVASSPFGSEPETVIAAPA